MAKRKAKRQKPRERGKTPRSDITRAIEASLAGLAHDIRTPLTGILALAELLATSDIAERERQWANTIKSGAEHLSVLTTLIIDAAKADAAKLVLRRETFPPRRLADAVGRALQARAETKDLKAEVELARDLPEMVAGDPLRLRTALENLADNAVKFTERGRVTFSARAESAPHGRVRLVFTFTDSGIGLSKEEIARLFRPFAQASEAVARRYGGAGLGLVFVRRLARAMGGQLTLESTPGKGTTFRLSVVVERADVRPVASDKRESEARAVAGRALSILCAEDNPYGRVVMNTILTELGHRTDFVETGEAAVQAVSRGNYDAVLMDVALAGIDGIEAARRIRALPGKAGATPIVGISGHGETGKEKAALEAGMNFYFTKPVSPGALNKAIGAIAGAA